MHPITVFLTAAGGALALVVLALIYQLANWRWKANPAAPLIIGVLLLTAAFAADVWLSTTAADIKGFMEKPPGKFTKEALELFLVTATSNDLLVKLIELFVIPLSVAIIATGLLAKVDLDTDQLQDRYNGALDRIRKLEVDKKEASERFEKGIRERLFDNEFFDAKRRLEAINAELIGLNQDLREDFKRFARSGLSHRFRRKYK